MTSPETYKIALSLFPKIGAINARKLVAYLGSLEAVFESSIKEFKQIPGFGKQMIKLVFEHREKVLEKAEDEKKFIQKYGITTSFYLDKNYPKRLIQCEDAPVILFTKGNTDLGAAKIVSVVGTRKASPYGRQVCDELVKELAATNPNTLIVSGLAFGIDVAAHKAAMKYGLKTVGVVGHGLDKMYPAEHAKVAREMIKNGGALVSDFPSNHKIDPGNFLRRNRIIAGLADCTVVVESANKGGALVTADIANSYNREVFAFPGRVIDAYSSGCNQLIKTNRAAMIENAGDLIAFMGWESTREPVQQKLAIDFTAVEIQTLNILTKGDVTTSDELARKMGQAIQHVNTLLLNLEFKGAVKLLPGNRIKLLTRYFT